MKRHNLREKQKKEVQQTQIKNEAAYNKMKIQMDHEYEKLQNQIK